MRLKIHWGQGFILGLSLLITLIMNSIPDVALAQERSGVKPQVISLPSGPGSLEGLGETFEPDLSTGTSSYPVKFIPAPGRVGFQPEISLNYDGGNANGPWGMGWKTSISYVQRRTENGLPTYDDSQDQFIYSNGEKLVALAGGLYRFENERTFQRFQRIEGGGWEARTPDGLRAIFGETENGRVSNDQGIFRWELERVIDTHGNEMRYIYLHDGGYAYPREIRYNFGEGGLYNSVVFNYEVRPDTYTDRRSGAPVRVGLRGTNIEMWAQGKLVRAYQFTYEPERSTGKYSLLTGVTQVGDDGTSMLPPHTFTYTQFDAEASAVVKMENPPPLGLTNLDAELVDINGDGLPDLVYSPEKGGHRFYLNRGKGRWQEEPVFPTQSPPERLSNPNVRMADMDGDGRVDLLVKAGTSAGAPFYYYTNDESGQWELGDRIDFGPAPAFDLFDPDVQLIDVNNDHRVDVVLTTGGRMKIWLARDGAWSQTADFDVAAPAAGDAARFSDPYIKVGDMTGDRMEDLVVVRDGSVVFWAHNGNGRYDEGTVALNPPTGVGAQDVRIQVGDLNNDGLVDLVLPGNRSVHYWLNLGDGSFTDTLVIQNTPAFDAKDTSVRLADMDGDGAVELLFSRYPAAEDEAMQYVDFSVGPQPFLLASIDNGLGRTIEITYKSSIDDHVADWDAGTPWQMNLPFPVQVMRQVKVHDANSGDAYTIDYHYRDGYYDGIQKEFRGFARSEEIKRGDESAATTLTRLFYDVGTENESRKGMLLESEVLAENGQCTGSYQGCYQRTVNQIATRFLVDEGENKRVSHSYVMQTDSFVHEQQAQPVQLRQSFEQDNFGNTTKEFNYGIVCGDDVTCGNDEVLKYTDYIYQETAWFMNRAMRVRQTDAAGNFVSESRFYYDGEPFVGLPLGEMTRGDLTRQEEDLGPNGGNRVISIKRQQFDSHGNVIATLDANGNRTTVDYDPVAHTFPIVEQLHFADGHLLTFVASYHPGFGQATSATDYNGNPHIFTFDTFGRLSKIVKPGDTLEQPTEQYSYFIGSPRSFIKTEKRVRSGTDEVVTSISYFDGLGRKLQVRRTANDGKVIVTEAVTFNARQGIRDQYLPYFSEGLEYMAPAADLPKTTHSYDPMQRLIRKTHPDGVFQAVEYQPLVEVHYDEEDNLNQGNAPTTFTYDGLKRLVSVEEINIVAGASQSYVTQYSYDRLGNLIKVVDAQGNTKQMEYDARSRKVRMDDPNKGVMTYEYDDNGNLIRTRDALRQEIHYTYDAANRPLVERWTFSDGRPEIVNATYHYDGDLSPLHPDAQNTHGQISYVVDQAGTLFFSYDPRGNVTGSIRQYTEGHTFVTRKQYDTLDRVQKTTFADGSSVTYEYDEQGLLKRIPGIVDDIVYNASAQRVAMTYANGAKVQYAYDGRQRLAHLTTAKGKEVLQDLGYTYDGVSNVVAISDGRAGRTPQTDQGQTFVYDSLQRLTSVSGVYGQIDFGYDAIGNLVKKSSTVNDPHLNLGVLQYAQNGAGPHAVTTAGGVTYSYDANGNLIRKGDTHYTWNARDLLQSVDDGETQSSYLYDSSSVRVQQTVRSGGSVATTFYPDPATEVRGGQLITYVFDDEKRTAYFAKPFNPDVLLKGFGDSAGAAPAGAEIRWYVADHLGGTNLVLDEKGRVVSEYAYYAFGETRVQTATDEAHYQFTGKELDASGLYYFGARYYDPVISRFISVDPLFVEEPEKGQENPQYLNLYAYTLNNPVKYIDPDGKQPNRVVLVDVSQPQLRALVVTPRVERFRYFRGMDLFQKGMTMTADVTLMVAEGKNWVPRGRAVGQLKFTALPNSNMRVVGAAPKMVTKPQNVKATAICAGGLCGVTRKATGGQYVDMATFEMKGTAEIFIGGKSIGTVGNAQNPYTFQIDMENPKGSTHTMPTRIESTGGVGLNNGRGQPDEPSHIITGPSELGPQVMKAEKPKH
jgi:RHS repeat-associated protein